MKKSTVGAAVAVTMFASSFAHAFSSPVTSVREYRSGPAKVVDMNGTFTLKSGERLLNVWLVAADATGREVSRAQIRFDNTTRRWGGGVGDFRLVTYYAQFRVRLPDGTERLYHTSRRTW